MLASLTRPHLPRPRPACGQKHAWYPPPETLHSTSRSLGLPHLGEQRYSAYDHSASSSHPSLRRYHTCTLARLVPVTLQSTDGRAGPSPRRAVVSPLPHQTQQPAGTLTHTDTHAHTTPSQHTDQRPAAVCRHPASLFARAD